MGQSQATRLTDLTPERLQSLSPQLRRAARFVVENPGDVATRSQRHVAEVSHLPAPTFTRLARAIGFDSYDGLRDICREDVLQSRTRLADRALAQDARGGNDTDAIPLLYRHVTAAVENMQALLGSVDTHALQSASRRLATARRVVLIGEMSARALADYASYVANMSLTGWKVLGQAGEGLSSDLANLGPGDACIVSSISPYSTRAVEAAQHVAKQCVPLVAITDNALSPIAAIAEHSIFVSTESPLFFPSHVPAMVVFEILLDMVIRYKGAEAQQHIAAVERQRHQLNEYWQDKTATNKGE